MPSFKLLIAYFGIFCSISFSCTSTTKEDKKIYLQLNNQLEHATLIIQESSLIYFRHLDSKTYDPHTAERARVWFPRAAQIRLITSDIFKYLEDLKRSLKSNKNTNQQNRFTEVTTSFVTKLSDIDSSITKEFKLQIDSISNFEDSSAIFSHTLSSEAILCLLSKLQNRISILESQLVAYCDNNVGSNFDGYYKILPLINQSSTHLNSDEELEINVGVGFLNYPGFPKVYVNGDSISSLDNGVFNYKMKVAGKAGKYYVPIKIEYYDYLEKITMNKTVEYYIK